MYIYVPTYECMYNNDETKLGKKNCAAGKITHGSCRHTNFVDEKLN